MKYTSNANRSPDSAKANVALLRALLETKGSEVSDVSLSLNVGPEYRALVEEFKRIGFPIVERSGWHAGKECVYFSLDRNLVAQELPLAIVGAEGHPRVPAGRR